MKNPRIAAKRAWAWLLFNQNDGGDWSALRGLEGSVEEAGLAVRVNEGTVRSPLESASILPDSGILKIFTQSYSRQRG